MSFLRDMVTRVWGEPVENLQPNVIVDPDNSTYIMHVNSDGSINAGIVSGESTSTAINDGTTPSQKASVSAGGALKVDNSAVTQPVSATSLPLPTGAATSANQSTANTSLSNIDTNAGVSTDTAVVGDNPGTQSAKLRGLSKIFNDVWDSVNHLLLVKVNNVQASGQLTKANSTSTVTASDEVYQEIIGNGTGVVNGANTDLFGWTDLSGFAYITLQISGTYSGTLTFQMTNDPNSGVVSSQQLNLGGTVASNSQGSSTTSTSQIWHGPKMARYFRVRMTVFSSNTSLTGVLELWKHAPFTVANTQVVFLQPQTTGGTSDYHLISANTTNAANIKPSAGQIYGYDIYNNNAAARFVKLYNKTTAPTVGTDTPFRTIGIAPNSRSTGTFPNGIAMGTGISIATTTGIADSDAGAVGASDLSVEIDYK